MTEDQRYTLIEYISHLMNSDYPRVADDLVRLGFVPEDRADPEKTAAVVPQLTRVMGQLIQGGGVRKINVQQVQICKGVTHPQENCPIVGSFKKRTWKSS